MVQPRLGSHGAALHPDCSLSMARITPVPWRLLEKVFLAAGFQFARQQGSQRAYTKPGVLRPVVIPTYIGTNLAHQTEVFYAKFGRNL